MRLRYLPVAGCVLALASQGLAQGCEGWNTSLFFLSATPAEVESCLAAGADVNARTIGLDYTPLHWAVWFNDNLAVITALMAAGADVGARDDDGNTPLHLAAGFNDNPAIVTVLIDAGADVDAWEDRYGWTPLHFAARFNDNSAIVTVLIDAGADVDAREDAYGWLPLHLAARYNDSPAIITVLIDAGADVDAREDVYSWTSLHLAAWANGNPAIVEALLDAGADATVRGQEGNTSWDLAQENEALRGTDAYRRLNDARPQVRVAVPQPGQRWPRCSRQAAGNRHAPTPAGFLEG